MKYVLGILLVVTLFVMGCWIFKKPPSVAWNFRRGDLQQEDTHPVVSKKPVAVLFGGDMQYDRYIRTVMRKRGEEFILTPLLGTLTSVDATVANLEGPITDYPSESETSKEGEAKNYVFTFPSGTASFLKREHIDIVNIGNNHILNFKAEGVEQTKKYLTATGVHYFGSPLEEDERIFVQDIHGTKIAFINYNQFVSGGEEKVFADLSSVKGAADFIVLYTHWGKEYEPVLESVRTLAHQFIDAGADLIIGSHPHIVQEKELYQGKMIYYSLGNFIFDQYFRPETESGLLVRAIFNANSKSIETQDIPIVLKNTGQTTLAE